MDRRRDFMRDSDTIAAIATPVAAAGLGVVRLSGSDAITVADRGFRSAGGKRLSDLAGYTALYGHVVDADGDIDDCVALVFRAPHSYTGENTVELSCHGGVYLLQRVLRAVLDAGARAAEAGEFTRRAFVNGKMDLAGAEAVMTLIAANGRLAAKTALAAREGAIYRRLEQVKQSLLAVTAQFSAFVDYPDDDIPELDAAVLEPVLQQARDTLTALLATYDAGRVLREGIDTVIVGSPNVGKSTLMNALAGCERSIVTDVAGTTRDIVEETVRVGEVMLRLSDTAGIRDTADEVESIGVTRARARLAQAALVLAVFDGSRPLTAADRAVAEQAATQTAIAVVNKTDSGTLSEDDKSYIEFIFQHIVYISAQNGDGLAALAACVEQVTGVAHLQDNEPVLVTERQRACARRCLDCVEEALSALIGGMTLDAVSVSIDGALAAVLELTGERTTEAVVEEIFSRFCVGK